MIDFCIFEDLFIAPKIEKNDKSIDGQGQKRIFLMIFSSIYKLLLFALTNSLVCAFFFLKMLSSSFHLNFTRAFGLFSSISLPQINLNASTIPNDFN